MYIMVTVLYRAIFNAHNVMQCAEREQNGVKLPFRAYFI